MLYKISVSGGVPQALSAAPPTYNGGTWNRDGTIIFRQASFATLYRIPAAGGQAVPVTELDSSKQEINHTRPQFLPDGRHFLFLAQSRVPDNNAIYVGSLDSKERKRLFAANSNARYATPGYILFGNRGALMAQQFDPDRLELSGEPFQLVDALHYESESRVSEFSVSTNGALAYRGGTQSTRLVWVDRTGKDISVVGPPGEYRNAAISPDEKAVLVDRYDPQAAGRDLWLYDLARATASRFTFDPADDSDAVWSPDGKSVIFSSDRNGRRGLYQKAATGVGQEENLMQSEDRLLWTRDWSSDGRFVAYVASNDVWILPFLGDRKPFPFLQSRFNEGGPSIAPNGRWIAYNSNESGKQQVYVQSFPMAAGKWQISAQGGDSPQWRRDGKELFYLSEDGWMMAVPISDSVSFQAGLAKPLFRANQPGWAAGGMSRYGVSADGQRFLINIASEETHSPITVVLNWRAGVQR
jgi:Tol biopolymer transport system component